MKQKISKAIFAAGCFWHVEHLFLKLPGVISATSGYTGGITKNPSYQEVCTGKTGHAEAVLIEFNPSKISYEKLLEKLWEIHDPTTLNRQGPDIGSQYRSAIFYLDKKQKNLAEETKNKEEKRLGKKIVTEIKKADNFYPAEEYHQKYFEKNKGAKVCLFQ
jgi:peptide-methionine (S)-S-oxide reductase